MKRRNFRFLVAAAIGMSLPILLACLPARAFMGTITLQSGGVPRTALIVEHLRLKKARRPVLIVLRNGKESGSRWRHNPGLGEAAEAAGALVIYPNALGGKWSDTAGPDFEHDAQFILELVNKMTADGMADRRHVFIVGTGTGGLTAMRLACQHGDAFAGVAALLAGLPADLAQSCHLPKPVRFLLMAATADPQVPFHGGKADLPGSKAALLSAEETLAIFGKAAGCSSDKTTTGLTDRDQKDTTTRAFADRLKGCKAPVELLRIEGGGHALPGRAGDRNAGPHAHDIDAGTMIWDFFRKPS